MATRRKSSKYHVERIRQLASVGWTAGQIADKLRLNVQTVYCYASLNGLDIPRADNSLHKERKRLHAEIVEYARKNLDQPRRVMAAKFGVSPPTILRILERAGLPTKRIYDSQGNVVDQLVTKA